MAVTLNTTVTASLVAENTFSDWFGGVIFPGNFNVSLSGTWVATVHVQRSFDKGVTALDVDSFTVPKEVLGSEPEPGVVYRVGIKTGNYTSGTVAVRISGSPVGKMS